jgi:hypothetical protein
LLQQSRLKVALGWQRDNVNTPDRHYKMS